MPHSQNRRAGFLAVLTLTCVGLAAAAQANSISVFSTGVDAGGTVLADGTIGDPHYALTSVPSGTTDIRIRTSAGGFPIPPYAGDNTLSRWIGPNNDSQLNGPVGIFTYRTSFNLTGLNPATAVIAGLWASDNNGTDILINGISLGNTTGFADFGTLSLHSFLIPTADLNAGLNTLDFRVNNGGGPTALRVEITSASADPTVVDQVAEPATLILVGVSLVGLGMLRRRNAPQSC